MSIKLQSQMNQVLEAEREIHVKGLLKTTDEKTLSNFFGAGFGKVESVNILKDVEGQAIIRFQKIESVSTSSQASNKLFLNGNKLIITARRPPLPDKANIRPSPQNTKKTATNNSRKNDTPSTAAGDAKVDLGLVGKFDAQLEMICQRVLLNQNEYTDLMMVASCLENVVQFIFPGARVLCFGSAVSGLAFKGSDLDCFIQLPEHLKNEVCYRRTSEEAQRMLVNRTKKLLYSYQKIFTNIVSIPNARIPIVKFVHRPSGYNCDVSFKNVFGISNTYLIKFLLNTDKRFLPLFTFIKYWAKSHNIVAHCKMTSYSLIMLIIFYLQQLDKPLLPPLSFLQRDPFFDIYEEGWNCGFDLSFETFPQTQNDLSLSTLVLGFFHYYSEFNFVTHVVCPLTGESIEKTKFLDASKLPQEMANYISNVNNESCEKFQYIKPMCVQDPIVLSNNTTRGVSLNLVKFFQNHCDLSIDNISRALDDDVNSSLVATLISQIVPKENVQNCKKTCDVKIPEAILKKFGGQITGTIVTKFFNNVSKIFLDIFNNILQCKSNGCVNNPPMPRNDSCVNVCYQCDVMYNVWDSRRDVDMSALDKESYLSREAMISEKIIEGLKETKQADEPLFRFSMNMKLRNNGKGLVLALKSKTCALDTFTAFVGFFHIIVTSALSHHLELVEE